MTPVRYCPICRLELDGHDGGPHVSLGDCVEALEAAENRLDSLVQRLLTEALERRPAADEGGLLREHAAGIT